MRVQCPGWLIRRLTLHEPTFVQDNRKIASEQTPMTSEYAEFRVDSNCRGIEER